MNRKETTKFLSNLLIHTKLSGMGKHWASEVTIDWGHSAETGKTKRVDFLLFEPENQYSISGIEKGIFTCYEVKSCKEDFYSGNGLNFIGEKNYIVTTMETYKQIIHDIPQDVGVYVAVPKWRNMHDEFETPTPIGEGEGWKLQNILPARLKNRERSIIELLFCMLRSGR